MVQIKATFFEKKMRGNYSKLYNIFRNSDVTTCVIIYGVV